MCPSLLNSSQRKDGRNIRGLVEKGGTKASPVLARTRAIGAATGVYREDITSIFW